MKLTLTAIIVMSVLQAPAALANEVQEKRPLAGILTAIGMFTGALTGGPGYAATAMVAGIVYDIQEDKKRSLQMSLQQKQKDYQTLQDSHVRELTELREQQAENEARFQLASARWSDSVSGLEKSVGYTLQFRTGSSDIEPHYMKDLTSLAHLLKNMPDLQLQLAGFSDRIGEESFNQQLSLNRVNRVENFFVKHGIEKKRIESRGYGESQPLNRQSSIEDNAFERRVMISVNPSYKVTGKAIVSN
jgi:outer membrane protein OmpA-like peptidoglycan-associated protein